VSTDVKPAALGRYRDREWKRFIEGPDPTLLEGLYIPMLASAVSYDRSCAYFSSSVLSAAARGFGKLIENLMALGEKPKHPPIRLVVNEELDADDVRALTETSDLSKLEATLLSRLKTPKDILEKKRLELLAWLYKEDLLDIQVGVMRSGSGIVHAKFGIATDADHESIVFNGSGNESAQGLTGNYEELEVSTKTADPSRHEYYSKKFTQLWDRQHPSVAVYPLPEAVRLKLIKFAPKHAPIEEPSNAAARQRAAMVWQFLLEAPYFRRGAATCDASAMVSMWPHQRKVVEETARAWPAGRLLCDEVGMGKTIEAILVLRRLLAGRGVERVLILLPAGLLRQWQSELREKGGLQFPRLEGLTTLVWPDGSELKTTDLAEALDQDLLLMSRETARTENNLAAVLQAKPWDLVLLDEAHAARRKEQEEGEYNTPTLLLNLLRELQLRKKARGVMLLSATPMQTHPWEPWDLMAVLGEGGPWLSEFSVVRNFYDVISSVKTGFCDLDKAGKAAALIAGDSDFPQPPLNTYGKPGVDDLKNLIAFAPVTQRLDYARWLREGSPLFRRMHRNTRATLRKYHAMGLLKDRPPDRVVRDQRFDYADQAERLVYDSVSEYIERRFAELEQEKPGKGFVMTVYRRRASSSPRALERSMGRRREALLEATKLHAFDPWLGSADVPELLDPDEMPEGEGAIKVSASLPQNPAMARSELRDVDGLLDQLRALGQRDSKRDVFFRELRRITDDGRSVLVFTEYTDTMEYLRDSLMPFYNSTVACYSGDGGQIWEGDQWKTVTKADITTALKNRTIQVLLCTDAASEGLNLQAAGALVNYDLPWNPSKVEQRIGRIDRIGQKSEQVLVVNLFLQDSVDERVYQALRYRCGLFEHFVGAMQPVLALARRMLRGEQPVDPNALEAIASQVEQDPLAAETYMESEAATGDGNAASYTQSELRRALDMLSSDIGFTVKKEKKLDAYSLAGYGFSKTRFGLCIDALEKDPALHPLTPFDAKLRDLLKALARPGERLPLIIGSHRHGAFRASVAYWMAGEAPKQVESLSDLENQVQTWDGGLPDPAAWHDAVLKAEEEAKLEVARMVGQAIDREEQAAQKQIEAARIRLTRELGRYLVCAGADAHDLKQALYQQMRQGAGTAGARMKQCFERLGGYPEWAPEFCRELEQWVGSLPSFRRTSRLAGMELDAALRDPRWAASS
jgi:hypothetical protein